MPAGIQERTYNCLLYSGMDRSFLRSVPWLRPPWAVRGSLLYYLSDRNNHMGQGAKKQRTILDGDVP